MRFQVVAADYDGTLANDGRVDKRTVETLVRVRASGRKVILITGRELDSLQSVFPELGLFD
ncbi:MAG: HAD hydrolase family protein, partial [Terriglobales bacterium]